LTGEPRYRVILRPVPTARRHWVTESPRLKEALDDLRAELGTEQLPFEEIIVRGAGLKLAELRGESDASVQRLHNLADRIRAAGER
jgi:hypothetical protein